MGIFSKKYYTIYIVANGMAIILTKEEKSDKMKIRNQESGIRNQESGIRNQESGIRNQESGI
jgi:hypothetical protein